MKQHLIRPPGHITSINVGCEGVIFTDGQPEWVSTPVAIALLHRGASNEGERDAPDPVPQMVQNPDPEPSAEPAAEPVAEAAPAPDHAPSGMAALFHHSKKGKKQR